MKKIISLILFVFLSVLPAQGRAEDLPVLDSNERDPRTFCPYSEGISREHMLIFVDVTDGMSEQQINLLKNDILSEDLLSSVGLYGKVSVVMLDGNKPVTSLEPEIVICRPKSGNSKSPDKRDHYDILTENRKRIDLEYRIGYIRRLKEGMIKLVREKSKNLSQSGYTPLMESFHEISRSSAIDFGDKYDKKSLIVISNMYHNSKSVPLDKLCVRRIYRHSFPYSRYTRTWTCPSFEDIKKKRSNKFYLERKIRPNFKGDGTNVKLWILHRDVGSGGIRDSSLLDFWESYFKYVKGKVNFLDPDFESDPSS